VLWYIPCGLFWSITRKKMLVSCYSFREGELKETDELCTAKFAIEFLLSSINRRLEIYSGPRGTHRTLIPANREPEDDLSYCLEDRIEELADVLEVVMDIHSRFTLRDGTKASSK
jgi:hypothetical protein